MFRVVFFGHFIVIFSFVRVSFGDEFSGLTENDNEIAGMGSSPDDRLGSLNLPAEFLESYQKKNLPFSLTSQISSLTMRSCTPEALPWIGAVGFCVPTTLLRTYCADNEASAAPDDCTGIDGAWCCYKPSPTAPPVISKPKALVVKSCTPSNAPWMGPKGFCAHTDQLNTYCGAMEISESAGDCPGQENWCCYKPTSPPVLTVKACTPDALTYIGRNGFCAGTDQLNTYCTELEISGSVSDCVNYSGNWCCYTPRPRPTTPIPSTTYTPRPITTPYPTVAYPGNICSNFPNLAQCRTTTTTTPAPLPYYYGAKPLYLPCSQFSYLSDCTTTKPPPQYGHG